MSTPITWYRMPNKLVSGLESYITGSVWWSPIDANMNYYAFVMQYGTVKSIITASLMPKMRFVNSSDETDVLGDFTFIGTYNNAGVWEQLDQYWQLTAQGYCFKAYEGQYVMITESGAVNPIGSVYVGIRPNIEMAYWTVIQPLMSGTGNGGIFADGTATPQGLATKTYTIKPYWPRWELSGYYSYYSNGQTIRYPQLGIYQPIDGAVGTVSFGTKNVAVNPETEVETVSYTMESGEADNHYIAQVSIWR